MSTSCRISLSLSLCFSIHEQCTWLTLQRGETAQSLRFFLFSFFFFFEKNFISLIKVQRDTGIKEKKKKREFNTRSQFSFFLNFLSNLTSTSLRVNGYNSFSGGKGREGKRRRRRRRRKSIEGTQIYSNIGGRERGKISRSRKSCSSTFPRL